MSSSPGGFTSFAFHFADRDDATPTGYTRRLPASAVSPWRHRTTRPRLLYLHQRRRAPFLVLADLPIYHARFCGRTLAAACAIEFDVYLLHRELGHCGTRRSVRSVAISVSTRPDTSRTPAPIPPRRPHGLTRDGDSLWRANKLHARPRGDRAETLLR
ncbi:hypothetical protein C8R45DRAFT_118478 [Mycena sanguinolenta]|nr:hypothetical protein C8R45DRAFT_118478 [Mycena sanguinolenta]